MNYKYTIYNLSYFIILRKYLLVPGLGDIRIKSIKHVFMKFMCTPHVSWLYFKEPDGWSGENYELRCCMCTVKEMMKLKREI